MKEKLKILFEYQRFQKNEKLAGLIEKYPKASLKELDLSELSFVNAAGDIIDERQMKKEKDNK